MACKGKGKGGKKCKSGSKGRGGCGR